MHAGFDAHELAEHLYAGCRCAGIGSVFDMQYSAGARYERDVLYAHPSRSCLCACAHANKKNTCSVCHTPPFPPKYTHIDIRHTHRQNRHSCVCMAAVSSVRGAHALLVANAWCVLQEKLKEMVESKA